MSFACIRPSASNNGSFGPRICFRNDISIGSSVLGRGVQARDVLCGLQLSGAPGHHAHVERRITWPASWRLGRESTNFERQQRAPFADDDAVRCTFSFANSDSSLFVIRFGGAGNESVPIQLALCCFPGLALSGAKIEYIFQIKYTAATISNSTRKLLWFEITKMVIVV